MFYFLHFAPGSWFQTQTSLFSIGLTALPRQLLAPRVTSSHFHESALAPAARPSSSPTTRPYLCDFLVYLIVITTCNKLTEEKNLSKAFNFKHTASSMGSAGATNRKILREYSGERSLEICSSLHFPHAFPPVHPLTTASSSHVPHSVFKIRHAAKIGISQIRVLCIFKAS